MEEFFRQIWIASFTAYRVNHTTEQSIYHANDVVKSLELELSRPPWAQKIKVGIVPNS